MENSQPIQQNPVNNQSQDLKIYKYARRSFWIMISSIILSSVLSFIFLVIFLPAFASGGWTHNPGSAYLFTGGLLFLWIIFGISIFVLRVLTIVFNILLFIASDKKEDVLFILVLVGTFVLGIMALICTGIIMNQYKKKIQNNQPNMQMN